jgi:transcription-repair coupling factor (superfamily II helicase)
LEKLYNILNSPGKILLSGVPEGFDARVLAEIGGGAAKTVLHVARDDARLARLADEIAFFAPVIDILRFPAWDCLPYDRVSPNGDVASERVECLTRLAEMPETPANGRIVLTTINALLQRVPSPDAFAGATFTAGPGDRIDLDELTQFLTRNGYGRAGTVREPGEYAIRGGIVDIFPPGTEDPLRLDLFGDEVEGIRAFDPATQRTVDDRERAVLKPVSEVFLDEASIGRFRAGYREIFGSVSEDELYRGVSEGRKQIGMEHWLPLFHEKLATLFDYLPDATITLDHQVEAARDARLETINDYYDARQSFLEASAGAKRDENAPPPYRPLPSNMLYLDAAEWDEGLADRSAGDFSPFSAPDSAEHGVYQSIIDLGGRRAPDFSSARLKNSGGKTDPGEAEENVFDLVRQYITAEQKNGRRIVVAGFTNGSRERLRQLLHDHGTQDLVSAESWEEIEKLPPSAVAVAVFGVEHGFVTGDAAIIGEQDILGDRLIRPALKRRKAENFIADATELSPGDFVVHLEHGIGRYEGLETLDISGARHDCLRLTYAGDNRLYVPVENVEVLSRFGAADGGAQLDRLGGAAWQARRSKLKKQLLEMAGELIEIAAQRALQPAPKIPLPTGLYEEFCARFPYNETDDQRNAIVDTVADLESGRPMDRLICGDVGFGKTEIALRAAFNTVMAGGQVVVVVPTTLLCRQHYATFEERFAGTSVRIKQLSRMVTPKDAAITKEGLASGQVNIVIGTHALLSKGIKFSDLTLLIIDEEQHFGVTHKERLKQLRSDVHVLTLTATPIPRTLQMALTGVKDMSMIATPPVDRLAVRTFVLPFDPVMVREAIMREHFRGGQIFYVCPRVQHLDEIAERLATLVPEIRIGVAHGRMPKNALEDVMNAFYDGKIDLLLSTQIVESGLDIPRANTLIIHRADMFGLAQLYQLRGRVGRSKLRAYCYLTLPPGQTLTASASKRLEVMQTLDTLGAGFTLASHDLDIRGAGNLLGDEQSGHIREVGVELYQQMLEEAVAQARGAAPQSEDGWAPQINIGMPVLIPERYVTDLDLRLGLYRRIATLEGQSEIESFAAEMIDRFGPLPDEVENLLRIVAIKRLCRAAGVEKLDAGPKGAVVSFRENDFNNPGGLIAFIQDDVGRTKLRPDHRLVYRRDWLNAEERLNGAQRLVTKLADIAA